MRTAAWMLLAACLTPTTGARGAESIPIAEEVTIEAGARREFTVQILDVPQGHQALIHFLGRQDRDRAAGSLPVLRLDFNRELLRSDRLANKATALTTGGGIALNWFGGAGWRLLYSPNFEQLDGPGDDPNAIVTGDAYEFLVDVTDLLQLGDNRLAATHLRAAPWPPIVLGELSIVFRRPEELYASPQQPLVVPEGPLTRVSPAEPSPLAYEAELTPNGGVRLTTGDRVFDIESDFTYPGGLHNRLVCGDPPRGGHRWWKVRYVTTDRQRLVASCDKWWMKRWVEAGAECVNVTDRIFNKTDEPVGMMITHEYTTPEDAEPRYAVGGLRPTVSAMSRHFTGNQTSFVSLGEVGLGLLPRDDVFKAHCFNGYEGRTLRLQERFFCLPPGGKHDLRWSIFPTPGGDYYDFINACRRELDVNFEVEGPFGFAHYALWMDGIGEERARRWLTNRSLQFVSQVIPKLRDSGVYAHGSAMLLPEAAESLEKLTDVLSVMKAANADVRNLMYFHCFLSTEPGAAEKYQDSLILKQDGTQDNYYNPIYPLFYPTLENSYGRAMADSIDMLLSLPSVDGIYWDEMCHSSGFFAYNVWDGHTALMHPDSFEITARPAAVSLLTQPFRAAMVERIVGQGHPLVANSPAETETMMSYHFPRFVETGSITALYNSHLFSPIGLGDSLTEWTPQVIVDHIRAHLEYGCLYYYYDFRVEMPYPTITKYMYPITPMELHAGYVIGEERILTAKAGVFGWGDDSQHEVHVFDQTGKEVEFEARTFTEEGKTWTELRLPSRFMASIVRRPAA